MGVGFGVQLIAGRRLGFLDCQYITDVVLLGGYRIAVGIGLEGFHHLTIQGDGILSTCQRVQGITLDLLDTSCGCVDGLLQGHRLGVLCVGQGDFGGLGTYRDFLNFHLAGGIYIDFVALWSTGFEHKVHAAVEPSPLCLTRGIGLADAGTDIASVRSIQAGVVRTGDGNGAGGITVQGEFRTCQIHSTCGIGLGQADRAGTFAIGSPVAAEVVEGVRTILCGGIHFSLDTVDKAGTEQLIGATLFPDGGAMVGAVLATKGQLADHGVGGLLHPRAGFKALIAVGTGGVGGFQPVLVGASRGFQVTNGIDAVGTAQVFSSNIRPNDGRNQGITVLRNTQFAKVGIQIVLDRLIAGTQIFQGSGIQRGIRCHGFALGNVQFVPGTVLAAKDNLSQIIFDSFAATFLVADNQRIGRRLSTGIIIVKPEAGETPPSKGATIACQVLIGEMVHIGIGIPPGLDDEGMGGDGKGVKDGGHGFAIVLAGAVPGDRLAGLDGIDDTSMGVIAVVTFIVAVVDHLHGDTDSDHVAGAIASGITAAVTAITDFGAGAAAVITCRTGGEHHGAFGGFFLRRDRFLSRFRFRCGCFCGRFFCFVGLGFRCFSGNGIRDFGRRLSFLILRCECRYYTKRQTGKSQRENQQKRQRFLHYIQSISSF